MVAIAAIGAAQALPREADLATRSQSLDWEECTIPFARNLFSPPPLPYECATLTVPFDYTDRESLEGLDLDLVRVKALNGTSQGSIVFNPGGPGGSGIEFLVFNSDLLHEILGGGFDLVSFDPRGTGRTIPFDCNHTYSPLTKRDELTVVQNLTELVFEQWDANIAYAEACAEETGRNGSVVGTTFVARDMAILADALDDEGILNYWGISYGTYLGTMFATLYPQKVGKFVLDSNINPDNWRSGYVLGSVQDADKALMGFLSVCIETSQNCSLAEFAPDNEPEELLQSFNSIAETSPEDYYILKLVLGTMLYTPQDWSFAADVFVELFRGISSGLNLTSTINDNSTFVLPEYNEGVDALHGIFCSDATWRSDSPEDMLPIIAQQQADSSFADMWYPRLSWPCTVWNITPAESYGGAFGSETRTPMLIANGLYDPVTPLTSARNVSAAFEGSVLLQHNGYGHGVTAHPSLCTGRAIRRYFESGEVPDEDTVCEPDVGPFALESELADLLSGLPVRKRGEERSYSEEDVRLLRAMGELGKRQNLFETLVTGSVFESL